MSDTMTPEAELKDKPAASMSEAFNAVVNETTKLMNSLSKALIATAEDLSSLMVIKVDADTREHLDLLVDSGFAADRRKAAMALVHEGIELKEETFERMRRTRDQIADLRKQMRNLVEVRTA